MYCWALTPEARSHLLIDQKTVMSGKTSSVLDDVTSDQCILFILPHAFLVSVTDHHQDSRQDVAPSGAGQALEEDKEALQLLQQ